MTSPKPKDRGGRLGPIVMLLIALLVILLSPFVLLGAVLYALSGFALYLAIWLGWCTRGRYILLVYSDSPIWREYIEKEIMPGLEGCAVMLNWSKRKHWRKSFAVLAFKRFGGWHAFNPLVVVFRPFHVAKVFRFFEPFQDFKHGNPTKVEKMKAELFEAVSVTTKK